MTPTVEFQERIRRYLLGQLSDGASEEFEQQVIMDEDLFEELLVAEDEIIDEYLSEKLDGGERTAFEQHFLATTERQEKLRFARALQRYVTVASQQDRKTSHFIPVPRRDLTFVWRVAAAVASVAILIAAYWFIFPGSSSPKTFATITLDTSAASRGEGTEVRKIQLPLNADALKIVLKLPERRPPAASYRVEFENVIGEQKSPEQVVPDTQSVTVVVRAAELKPGQYSLKLFAVSVNGGEQRIAGNYFFTVE